MPSITIDQAKSQLQSLRNHGFADKLAALAGTHGFPDTYFFAIASRETNCQNILGDFQGGQYHGVGIIQIDIQHDIARQARDSGSYQTNPGPLLSFGADLIKANIHTVAQHFPNFTADQHLKIAASAYNCGPVNAIRGAENGDSDSHTTGHDYGHDVMVRKGFFDQLVAAGH